MNADNEQYQYFMRPDPEQKEFVGPPQVELDELTGLEAYSRIAKVGMVRNARDEDKKTVRVYLKLGGKLCTPHIRVEKANLLRGWYQDKDNQKQGGRPRACFTEAMLAEPYGGFCPVGCLFCYINAGIRGYRGTGLTTVPLNYGPQLRKQLAGFKKAAAGYFSPFVDAFMPLEEVYHNTQQGAEAFAANGLPVFFCSRLHYPDWAVKLLQQNKYSYAQKSISTSNQADWEALSPGALPIKDHMDEIRLLRSKGIYVSIQVNPIIPGVTSVDEVQALFKQLAAAGANHVIVKFVEAGYSWHRTLTARVTKKFPERRDAFKELFTENGGGQKTIQEAYRRQMHSALRPLATELGMTYAVCHEYAKNDQGKLYSLGRELATSSQCHGPRVPMFTREDTSQTYEEVKGCAPTGCLYCADNKEDGTTPCGNENMGKAKALRAPDYRAPVLYQLRRP